jgi:hypothetical protein
MGQGAKRPLSERRGPATTPTPENAPNEHGTGSAIPLPPGTHCWLNLNNDTRVGGVVLGWQQQPNGEWWALVSAWVPQDHVRRR